MSNLNKIKMLQTALKNNKSDFKLRKKLAVLLLDDGYSEEALAHFLYLAKIFEQDSWIFYNLGITYEKLRNLPKAEEAYKKALELNPDDIDACFNLGLVETDLQHYDEAIQYFQAVLKEDDTDSNAHFSLGLVYFKAGRLDLAKECFTKTVKLYSDDLYAHFYLGNIYKAQSQIDLAREEFKKVLEISPDYSWAYFNLASIDYELENLDDAAVNLENTLQYNAKDKEAYRIFAKVLLKQKKHKKALNVVTRALKECGEEGDMYYLQAQICKKMENIDGCKKALNQALTHHSSLTKSPKEVKKELDNLQ